MRVMVIGGGGREHALCWALAGSPLTDELYCAPGNAGTIKDAVSVNFAVDDVDAAVHFAHQQRIDLVVVGPEAALAAGMTDALIAAGCKVFGPSKAAARVETSKAFMKDLCRRHDIPTPAHGAFTDPKSARTFARKLTPPIAVKADGLAAGKGVRVCATREDADAAIHEMLVEKKLGAAGRTIVVEQGLAGREVSAMALVDGQTALMLPTARDYKRAFDNDEGPNTGGMGAVSPDETIDAATLERIRAEIVQPAVDALAAEGQPFKGVLYAGVMLGEDGPQVLEFNARFGDPEVQVLVMRLMSDLLPALVAACDGVLDTFDLRWFEEAAVTVVMAAQGYPGAYDKGAAIEGLDNLSAEQGAMAFHAGTDMDNAGNVITAGGRVLAVTALGESVAQARDSVYQAVRTIEWPGAHYRTDIAADVPEIAAATGEESASG